MFHNQLNDLHESFFEVYVSLKCVYSTNMSCNQKNANDRDLKNDLQSIRMKFFIHAFSSRFD